MRPLSSIAILIALAACSPKSETQEIPPPEAVTEPAPEVVAPAPAPAIDLSTFAGKWSGPEGTSLTIAPNEAAGAVPTQYKVTIVDLDGPKDFVGSQTADGIAITRAGQDLVIRKGSGDETGMKWLAGKKDCLVVAPNEGYCKD